jgi:hypothetical protein
MVHFTTPTDTQMMLSVENRALFNKAGCEMYCGFREIRLCVTAPVSQLTVGEAT